VTEAQLGYLEGRLFAFALVVGAIIAAAVFVGKRLGRNAEPNKFVWWPLIVAAALVALLLVNLVRSLSAPAENSFEPNQDAHNVIVQVDEIQMPKGPMKDGLSAQAKKSLEDSLLTRARDGLVARNMSLNGLNAKVDYLGHLPNSLILTSVSTEEGILESHVMGLKGDKQIEVLCVPSANARRNFEVTQGDCGAKIREKFGDNAIQLIEGQ
jgi:hypothetical protein